MRSANEVHSYAELERLDAAVAEARAAAIEECARWHDAKAFEVDYQEKASGLDHRLAQRHREHARQHRYAAEQLRQLKAK